MARRRPSTRAGCATPGPGRSGSTCWRPTMGSCGSAGSRLSEAEERRAVRRASILRRLLVGQRLASTGAGSGPGAAASRARTPRPATARAGGRASASVEPTPAHTGSMARERGSSGRMRAMPSHRLPMPEHRHRLWRGVVRRLPPDPPLPGRDRDAVSMDRRRRRRRHPRDARRRGLPRRSRSSPSPRARSSSSPATTSSRTSSAPPPIVIRPSIPATSRRVPRARRRDAAGTGGNRRPARGDDRGRPAHARSLRRDRPRRDRRDPVAGAAGPRGRHRGLGSATPDGRIRAYSSASSSSRSSSA